jgi:hypothetical protein
LHGSGYLLVGDAQSVDVSGTIADPTRVIGAGNIGVLKSVSTFTLPEGECAIAVSTGDFPLSLVADGGSARYSGFITGNGSVRIEAAAAGQPGRRTFEIAGPSSNAYKGQSTLARGVLKLNKAASAIAIPGNLTLGGSAAENKDDGVIWGADGQLAPTATVTLEGNQPSFLDLDGHTVALARVVMSRAGRIRTGTGGKLQVKQLFIDGKRLTDGDYAASHSWLEGTGSVTVDARVNVQGVYGAPDVEIGQGNIAVLTGETKFAYPASGSNLDVVTQGFTLKLDSGDGNAFAYSGSLSGTGNVEFFQFVTF